MSTEKINILIIEDDEDFFHLYNDFFETHGLLFTSKLVSTHDEFLGALDTFNPSVILSDYSIPDFNGMLALQLAKQHAPTVPFIFVTGALDEEVAVGLIKAGANDYILKTNFSRFIPAIEQAVTNKKITEQKEAAEKNLRDNEEFLRTILDSISGIVFTLDEDLRFKEAYGQMTHLYGIDFSRYQNKTVREAFGDHTGESFEIASERAKVEPNVQIEWSLKSLKSKRVLDSRLSARRNFKDEFVGFVCITEDITIRKKNEEALKRSEENYRSLFENAAQGISRTDTSGKFISVNPAMVKMFGYESVEEMLAVDISPQLYLDPVDRQKLHSHLMREKSIKNYELVLKKKDGSHIFVKLDKRIVGDEAGNILYFESFWDDITERKKMEEALRQSEEDYRSIFENAVQGTFRTSHEGKFIKVNPALVKMLGYDTAEDLMSIDITTQLYFDSIERQQLLEKTRAGKKIENYRIKLKKKNGDYIYANLSERVQENDSGDILFYEGIIEDITEKIIAEEALKSSETKFRTLYESTGDAVMLLDEKGFFECNNATLSMFGFSTKEEFCTNHPAELSPPMQPGNYNSLDLAKQHINAAIVNGRNRFEWMHRRIDGTDFPAEVLLTAMELDDRKIIQAVVRDISERKALELELLNRNKELEAVVENIRTMQGHLIQSEKMASIGQLTAGIAHEINNPLAFVSSNMNRFEEYISDLLDVLGKWQTLGMFVKDGSELQALLQDIRNLEKRIDVPFIVEDFQNLMKQTREGTQRIKTIVDKLRVFSHKGEDKFVDSNLQDAIEDTITIVWNEIKYKADIKKEYSSLPSVYCNPGELKQVFTNLLINAAQAIPERGVINVKTYAEDKKAVVEISDNGNGIAPEHLNKIFDPFFTTKAVGKGTGLGLWISMSIILNHKGLLTVDSEVGKGTKFKIKLPLTNGTH